MFISESLSILETASIAEFKIGCTLSSSN